MKKIISILLVVLLLSTLLTACGVPSDCDEAKQELSDKGYNVLIDEKCALIQAMCNVTCKSITATNTDNEGVVYAYYFNSKDDATTAYDYIKELAGQKLSGAEVTQDGEIIYFGNEQGIEDFE